MRFERSAWLACLMSVCTAAHAHHSYTEFNQRETVEIEGTLVAVKWQNPHTQLEVRVPGSPNSLVWDIEMGSVNSMRRQNAPLDSFAVGDAVKVAGWPSKRSAARMYATNVLGDGYELMFQTNAPRWPDAKHFTESFTASTSAAAATATPTLFRVWAIDASDPDTRPGFINRFQYSLTDAAKQAVAAFDPVTQSVSTGCTPKGMPLLMGQPFPIEFVEHGDTILCGSRNTTPCARSTCRPLRSARRKQRRH